MPKAAIFSVFKSPADRRKGLMASAKEVQQHEFKNGAVVRFCWTVIGGESPHQVTVQMEYDYAASAGAMIDDFSVAGGSHFYEVQANGAAVLISRTLVREALVD